VRVRLSNDESDHIDWYEPAADNNPLNAEVAIDPDRDELDQQRAQVDKHNQLVRMFYDGIGEDFAAQAQAAEDVLLLYRYQVVQKRWEKLHDAAAHQCLRDAITAQVVQNSIAARNPVCV
jgi:hypothetical protein